MRPNEHLFLFHKGQGLTRRWSQRRYLALDRSLKGEPLQTPGQWGHREGLGPTVLLPISPSGLSLWAEWVTLLLPGSLSPLEGEIFSCHPSIHTQCFWTVSQTSEALRFSALCLKEHQGRALGKQEGGDPRPLGICLSNGPHHRGEDQSSSQQGTCTHGHLIRAFGPKQKTSFNSPT